MNDRERGGSETDAAPAEDRGSDASRGPGNPEIGTTDAIPRRRPVNSDLLGAAACLALAALFWLNREEWSFWSAVFPNLSLAVLALLATGLLVKGLVRPEMRTVAAEGNRTRIVVTGVVLVLWALAIRPIGTVLTSLVAFYGLTLYLSTADRQLTYADAAKYLVLVALEIGVLYLLFARALGVRLPQGILF